MAREKFYVVWQGVKPGIYSSWEECRLQVFGFENARYKSFTSLEEAKKAFNENPWKHLNSKKNYQPTEQTSATSIIRESIAVDAACSGNPGLMEYRGVFVADGVEIFHVGPLEEGTNNIGEFLAIVHALALLQKSGRETPLYTDSVNAMKWVERKKCNTKLEQSERNRPLFDLIARAEKWLRENSYKNPILKWETKKWGEIPADFGRK
ncbi:MAG: ribonuclease H family protein [Proteiniphilum sp.]|nr:ribonuclease H family protein [Proteiniphilum sp.]